MEPIWGLAILLLDHLSLILLSFLVCSIWVLFSRYRSWTQGAAKTEDPKQHILEQIENLTVSQLEDSRMNSMEGDLTCISGSPMGWTQNYVLWSIDKSLRQIFQHLENASLSLMELNLPESHDTSSSSISDTVAQETAPPCCYCENGKHSTDYSISSESSNNSSILSYLPIFSERTTWQMQSNSAPDSLENELPLYRSQSTPLPTFQLTDTERSDLFQNFAVLPPLQAQSSFIGSILQSLDSCKQEKTKDRRNNHLLSDHGSNSVSNKRLGPIIWAPLQLSPLVRGELEGHMSQKVSTLQRQVVPLPVKKSWEIRNHLMDEQGTPKTQLQTPIPQSTEPSTNKSSDVPSIHLHVNIGLNSEVNRTEARMPQPLTTHKQLESENDHQIIRYNPLVISMDTPFSRNLGANAIPEETTLLKRDPKPVLELNIKQRAIGLPEERIQLHKAQEANVELTPKVPSSVTDSTKVTRMALLQVMDSMGIIPDSHPEVIDSVGKIEDNTDLPQPPNQAEAENLLPKSSNLVVEFIEVASPQHQTRDSKSVASRLKQITDNSKVTPVALFHILDSRGLINEICSHVIESAGIAPQPQYQVMKPVGVDTLHKHQAVEPVKMSLGPCHTVFKAGEGILQPQHDVTETLNMNAGSQNQATEQMSFTPSSLQPPQPPSKVLDSSRMIPEGSEKFIHIPNISSMVQGSPTGVITPVQAGLIAQSAASASQIQVTDSIGMVPPQGTEYVLLTPKLPHQVMGHQEFTSWYQDCSEVSPRHSHKMTEPTGLTSDTWPQRKNPTKMIPSHHEITESPTTAPGAPDQGMVPTGMSQSHQLIETEVVPATPKLREMEYLGENTTPQPKVIESVNLPPELQNINSENLVPDPRLQGLKLVDASKDLIPEMAKDGPLTPMTVSTDLAPEQQQQSIQSEELTPIPQLQTEKPVLPAPESQLQDVKTVQQTVEPQLQNIQSSGLAPSPQLQSNKSVNLIPGSQSQGMEDIHLSLPQEVQEDVKMVALTPIPPLEDIKSENLAPEPCSQNISSDKIAHVSLLEDTKIPLVDSRSLIPETLVQSMNVNKLTTQLYSVKPSESPDSSYSFPEPGGLAEQQQAPEDRVTSDTCHQVEESAELTQSSVGMTPAPLSQTSESMEMSLPPLQYTLETGTQVAQEMETSGLQNASKDTLDLLPESEVPTINPEVMVPEPQLLDVKFAHGSLETCSEVTNPSEISLYKYTGNAAMTLPEADDTHGTIVETYSEMGTQGLNLEPRVQIEESESLAEKLKLEELASEPSVLGVEPTKLTTGPTPHITDMTPGPQIEKVKSRQIDTGLELQNEISVDLVQQSSIGMVDPKKAKPEPGLQSLSPKESVERTQIPNMKSVDLNLDQEQPIVKPGLIPGPQLQSVRFPKLYQGLLLQGKNPANSISDPPHYSVKSEEAISYPPMPEIRSSGLISGPKAPEPQPHMNSMEVNLGPCLQDVRFSDLSPEPKNQGFKYTQFTQGFPLQERVSQRFMPESLLPLRQEPKFEDKKLALPTQGSEFHSMKFATQASEPQHPRGISEEINTEPLEQDAKFSELASRPKLQKVKFGEQISGSVFVSGSSMTPELGIYNSKLAKMTPGLQDTRQVSFNSGPWLQDVKFLDVKPGTLPQSMKTSEINLGPHLECVKIFELTTQPERQGMKPELIVQESPFQDVKYVTEKRVPSFEDKMSYKAVSEPQIPTAEPMKLAPGRHLVNVNYSELIRKPQTRGIVSSELIKGQPLEHMEPEEKNTVSKEEAPITAELKPGPHLGDITSTKLKSRSEMEHVTSMLLTPGIQAGDRKLEELPLSFSSKGLKPKLIPSKTKLEDRQSVILTVEECLKRIKSAVVSPSSSPKGDTKPVRLIPGSGIQDLKNKGLARGTYVQDVNAMDLKLEPKKQGESPVTSVSRMLFQEKSMKVFLGPQLQSIKPKDVTSQPQMQDKKPVISPSLEPQSLKPVTVAKTQGIQEVKCVDFTSTQQCQGMAPLDLTLKSRKDQITVKSLEWEDGISDQKKQLESENTLPMESDQKSKPADMKPVEINSKLQFNDTTSFELAPEPVVQNIKAEEFQNEQQVPSMKPCQWTSGSQLHQEKALESTLDPQLQGVETMALNTEPQIGSTKSIQWIPISEFQSEKDIGSNSRSQFQDARPTAVKPPILWRGVRSSELTARSNNQGEKSVAVHLEPQLRGVKTTPLAIRLQEPKTFNLTSEPQLQSITPEPLNKEPQAESVRSVQWLPRQEFSGVKFLGSNSGSPSQGVKWTEQKPSIKLGGGKPSEMTQEQKLQGKKSLDFNLRTQQCVKTLQLSPGPELQMGRNFASSEPQSQCVETVPLHHEPQLENTKPVFQDKKSMHNLGLQPQGITSKELKPSVQERDVMTSEELLARPKTEGKEPFRSAQECLSHGFKTIEFKSEMPFRSMKTCDPTLRSMITNIKSITFKPRFHKEDRSSPELTPGIQSKEAKPLKSSPGTQPQDVIFSVFKQESQSSEWKPLKSSPGTQPQDVFKQESQSSESISEVQGSQSQDSKNIGLKSEKFSGLALHTKPQGMKSEMKSEPQGRSTKCSDLTPETKSQNMKFKLSHSSLLKSKPFTNFITGTKIRRVKLDSKPGPQSQGIKSDSVLKTKPQEMEMEDCKSGPQLQDLTSWRTIMGVKVQDVKSAGFTPRPHLEGMPSEVIMEKNVHGMKPVEIKPSPKLQGGKPEFTSLPRKSFLGTKSIELDSGLNLQDLKYPELIMGMKHQGVDSVEQHLTTKPSVVIKQINSQSVTAVNFDSESQTQNKPSGLVQGEKLQDMESLEFNQGPKLQSMTVESIPETKPQHGESAKLNSGPQLQDKKYSKSILETKLQDGRSTEVSFDPHLQGVKSSEGILGNMVQKKKPIGFVYQPLGQDVESLKWIFSKALDGKPLQIKLASELQNRKLSKLHPQGMKPEAFKPGLKSEHVKAKPTNLQTKKDKEVNYADLQVVGFSELASPIYNVVPPGLKARNQKQDGKAHRLSQEQQLQRIKSTVFNHEPHLQHIKSSDLCTKLQDLKSMEFNSEQELQDVKASELGLGTNTQSLEFNPRSQLQERKPTAVSKEVKLLEESSLEFKHDSRLQRRKSCDWSHSKNVMAPNTVIQDVESSELHPGSALQGIQSKVFCPGSHLEDVNSTCIPNINSQYVNFSGYISGPYLKDINSSACIPEPNAQCINSECNPGIHLHGVNSSSCFSGSKLQCVDSTGSNPESHLQAVNSTKCTPEPSPQCANSYACTPGSNPHCADSSACTPGPSPQCANSYACTSESSPPCVNSSGCSPGLSPPCGNSTECNPQSHLQGMNSSVSTSGQNPLCDNSNRYNLGPLFQGTDLCTFPPPQILCVNPVWCDTRIHLQDINASACTTLQRESQSVNSIGYNPGPHLHTPKLQKQHLKDLKSELTPGSSNLGTAPMEYNPGPQHHSMNSFEFNPESKPQCISYVKPSSGPQLQSIKSFELTPGSESQSTDSLLLTSGSPFQGVNSSNLMLGAKDQDTPFLKNQFGSWQQNAQSIFTLRPQLSGVDSVVLPVSPPEDGKSPENAQTLFCANAVKLTPGCSLHNLRSKEFSPVPCFQNVQAVHLTPGSQSQSGTSSELTSCHSSQHVMSSLVPKPCFQDSNPKQLRIESQQQSLNCQLFPSEEKPMMAFSLPPTRKLLAGPALTSVKFSNLPLKSQQQNTKSLAFTSEPKWQSVKPVKLSSVSLPETEKYVELPPKLMLQNMKYGSLMSQTIDPVTKSSEVIDRLERQVVDFAEMSMKPKCQVPKLVNVSSPPIYQDVGSLEMAQGFRHKSTEMMEKSMRLSSEPTDEVTEPLEMPLKLDLQVPEFVLTPSLGDEDSKSSEPNLQNQRYHIPETPELHSWSWPQFQDFKKLQSKEVTESDIMTLNFKNNVADMVGLTCEARQQGKEFLRMTPMPVNRETECMDKSPRPCVQDLGPLGVGFKERSQREQSVVSTSRSFCHVPESVSGLMPGPGPQIPKSRNLTSMLWLQKESSELSWKQTSQVVANRESAELTFGTRQPGGVAAKLIKPQNLSLGNANFTPIESLDKTINFVGVSPKSRGQVTESAKTQLPVPQLVTLPKEVSESVEEIPGPPLQIIKNVRIPEPASQESKYNDLTPRIHNVISSEFAASLWLHNVQSKKLITEPTHQVLETIGRTGFRIIKTVLSPKPLLLIIKSEEVTPGPCPQTVEPVRLAMRSSIKVKECLNLPPKPHLQDLAKPMQLTPRADTQVTSAELIIPQTSNLKEPPVLTHEQRLQAEKSLGLKTGSPKVTKIEDLNQRSVCQNKGSDMITSAKLQAENYISRFIHNPSTPFLSSIDKTTELGQLQGSGVPVVSRAFHMKNFGVGILQPPKSYTDTIMIRSSVLPLVLQNLPSDKTGDTKGTPYPEIWRMNILPKEETGKEKMEEFQRYSSYSLRLLSEEFQAGFGARRSSIRSFLGIQQNVWESHVCRQRLPRRYLSSMLMLGNVLGTTMERKPCSQSLDISPTMDICQSIQNLFGVPAELMEFSQRLLERGPRTISQTSVAKNYIQRHTLCHSNEKRMPLKMWTRSSTSSIIQQYSGTRLGIKKTSSKLSDMSQEVAEHVSVSCTGARFPALMKSESTLEILYTREDSLSREQSKISPCGSPTRTFESPPSLKTSSLSQSKTDFNDSEQLQLLRDLQLKIAGKLLRSQIPHSVPPPLASGLVLKYPICLQCGRCSGFNCCHKLQSAFGPYLLIYPQLHLLSTPEGHGEIRLHLGFRLRTGKRPQVSKYHGRNQADAQKGTASPSQRKTKFHTPVSKSPSPGRDLQSRLSLSPASVQAHTPQKQWHSHGVAGKTTVKDYEFCQVHSVSESDYESNQNEKWVKSSLRRNSVLTYPMKKLTKRPKAQNTRHYKISTSTKESHSRTLRGLPRSGIEATQTSTASCKRQPKKSSQPKFIQLLFHGLRQAFQAAHRIVTFTGQKLDYKINLDNLWSIKHLHPKQRAKDSYSMGDSKGARTPAVRHRSTSSNPKPKDKLQGASERCRQAQQPPKAHFLLPRTLQLQKTMFCGRGVFNQATSVPEPLKRVQNVSSIAKKSCSDEISSPESKNCSKVGAKCQAQEKIISSPLLNGTLQSSFGKKLINKEEQQGFFREPTLCNKPSERTHSRNPQRTHRRSLSERRHHSPSRRRYISPSDRTFRSLSERSHCSPCQRYSLSSSVRTYHSLSDRSHNSLFKGRGHSPSRRRPCSPSRRCPQNPLGSIQHSPSGSSLRSPSMRSPQSPSRRSPRSPSRRSPHSPSRKSPHSPSGRSPHSPSRSPRSPSGRSPHSPSGRSPHSPSRSPRSPSGRSPHSPSGRSPHRRSGRSPCRPLERRGYSSSVKKSLHSLSGRSQQSPSSLRCPSPSKRSHLSLTRRSLDSHSEKSHGSFSERSFSIPSDWKRHNSGITQHTSSKSKLYKHSSKLIRSHSERNYSPSESRHSNSERTRRSHSERNQQGHYEKLYHNPKKRFKHNSPKERSRCSLTKEFMSSRDDTKKPKSWTSLEA